MLKYKYALLLTGALGLVAAGTARAAEFSEFKLYPTAVEYDIPKGGVHKWTESNQSQVQVRFDDTTHPTSPGALLSGATATATIWDNDGAHCVITGTLDSTGYLPSNGCTLLRNTFYSVTATIPSAPKSDTTHLAGEVRVEVHQEQSTGPADDWIFGSGSVNVQQRTLQCTVKYAKDVVLKPGVLEPVTQDNECNLSWTSGIGTLTDEDTGNTVPFYNLVAGQYRATSASPNEELSLLLGSPPTGGTYKGSEAITIEAP